MLPPNKLIIKYLTVRWNEGCRERANVLNKQTTPSAPYVVDGSPHAFIGICKKAGSRGKRESDFPAADISLYHGSIDIAFCNI